MNKTDCPRGRRGPFALEAQQSYTLPSRYYFDRGIYQRELETIFHHSWCYVGHANQLRKSGDFRVDRVADQCIFLVRIDHSTIKAFYNVCQHRGHQLLNGEGNTKKRIVCPYHAWTYGLDGALVNAPLTEELENFEPFEYGLREIALHDCNGLLFVNLDVAAPSFADEYAGLDAIFEKHLPGLRDFAAAHKISYDIAANWKVVVDNFSEGYHIPVAHRQLSQLLDSKGGSEAIVEPRYACFKSRSKSGYAGLALDAGEPYISWTMWPNTCMLSQPGCDNLIVLRMAPAGPTTCFESVDILSPGGESSANLEALKSLFMENFNLEDIAIVESVQQGLQSLGYDQGRYVADSANRWYSESGLHKFHLQVLEALSS